ncbi:Crinkler (CRN) [Phytophthora megakarya]|uniref:Crinkler (CRN) n=1 Tax=Phytophthora megakarya TaxID=4795 RepID=A0A225UH14_9STRA|nr:Crinkler (CRN) [Phytophthora megakarya]
MTIVSRFPTYQFIPFAHDAKQAAWDKVTRRFLVVNAITEYSRGRFTRVVDFVLKTPVFTSINLISSSELQDGNGQSLYGGSMWKEAQLLAIFYTNTSPAENDTISSGNDST